MVGEETHVEFLARLKKYHGENKYYYFSSHKIYLKFKGGESLKEAIHEYATKNISEQNLCDGEIILDETASWTSDRDVIYLNFFCEVDGVRLD
jgi:YHS domain-containing protein